MTTHEVLAFCRQRDTRGLPVSAAAPDPARDELRQWFADARDAGWTNLDAFAREAMRLYGAMCGFVRCQHCGAPCVWADISAGESDSEAVELWGGDVLCRECFDGATEARAKVVVHDDYDGLWEDDSALTDEERTLAAYIERSVEAQNRLDRETIRDAPPHERRDLHRYQDEIDLERSIGGKRLDSEGRL